MRPNTPQTVVHSGVIADEVKFGLDPRATAHLIGVLTNLYSDPIEAIVREYTTNARDSHIEAGNENPIAVNIDKTMFSVEDHGVGLSIDELHDVFSLYGASTKRDSDAVAGMLGLGCKSAMTYADSFNITATKQGVRVLATIVKDTDGVGIIKILDTRATDRPDGVRVDVPINRGDEHLFLGAARDLFHYWTPGTVTLNGEKPDNIRDDVRQAIWLDEDVAILPQGAWASGLQHTVVQAGVPYPVKYGKLPQNYGVVAFVPTGSVNFTPSREELHYSDLTDDTLATLKEYVEEKFYDYVKGLVDAEPSPWSRLKIINKWRNTIPNIAFEFNKVWGVGPKVPAWFTDKWGSKHPYIFRYTHGSTKRQHVPGWFDLLSGRKAIVTGFPYKAVSNVARERLAQVFYAQGSSFDHPQAIYLLPEGTINLGALEGAADDTNTIVMTWQEVTRLTHIEPEKRETRRTKYTMWFGGEVAEVDDNAIPDDAPLLYVVRDVFDYGRRSPEARIIVLKNSAQIDKFTRVYPWAAQAHEYIEVKIREAKRALTEADVLKDTVNTSWWGFGLSEYVDQIDDPLFRKIIATANTDVSPALQHYYKVSARRGLDDEGDQIIETIDERYPLASSAYKVLSTCTEDHLLHYVNSTYYNECITADSQTEASTPQDTE